MTLSDEIIEGIRTLWADGLSVVQIGKRLGISKNTVVGRRNRMGLPTRGNYIAPKRTAEKCALIDDMLRNGMSVQGIARETQTGEEYVRGRRNELDIKAWNGPASRGRRSIWARDTAPRAFYNMDLFDDPISEPAPVREARVVPLHAPAIKRIARGGCQYPMWNHNERAKLSPDGMALVCEAAIVRGTYCTEHAALCYSRKIAA